MKFSIIIPVYNIEKYISKCIESVLDQTFPDYEIIAVNDGSQDNSLEVLEGFQSKNPKVKVINQLNQGIGGARNAGIEKARGDYILFLDGDDFWTRADALEYLANITENKDFDILVYPVQHASDDDLIVHDSTVKYEGIFSQEDTYEDILNKMLGHGMILSSMDEMMIRREFLVQHSLYFPKRILSEDIDWIIRMMQWKPRLIFDDFKFCCYRWDRPGSICNSEIVEYSKIKEIIAFINKYYFELIKNEDAVSRLILHYIAYHWCVQAGKVTLLENKAEQEKGFRLLAESKGVLKYNKMKKVKVFRIVTSLFGLRKAASIGIAKYKWKRRHIK